MTRSEMEARRLLASEVFKATSQGRIAKQFGVSRTTVCRWFRLWRAAGGKAGLLARPATGRRPRMDWNQYADELRDLYARAEGRDRTTAGFAAVIEAAYGIHYDADHISRVMRRLGIGKRIQEKRRTA